MKIKARILGYGLRPKEDEYVHKQICSNCHQLEVYCLPKGHRINESSFECPKCGCVTEPTTKGFAQ